MNLETINIAEATRGELHAAAMEYGYNIASWQDMPDIGDKLPRDIDWIGTDTIDDENDQRDALEMMATAAEEHARCFSPAEFWISAINERDDRDDAWEQVDAGIMEGIQRNIAERFGDQ